MLKLDALLEYEKEICGAEERVTDGVKRKKKRWKIEFIVLNVRSRICGHEVNSSEFFSISFSLLYWSASSTAALHPIHYVVNRISN